MPGIDFYYLKPSAPCRSVEMVAKHLGVPLNLKVTNLLKGKNLTPEFIKINPAHTIPTIVDDGFSLFESRPIMEYLAEKYGKGKLYPSDLQKRAVMRQLLSFDATSLSKAIGDFLYPQVFQKEKPNEEKKEKLEEKLELLQKFLQGPYFGGNELSLADFAILSSVTTLEALDFSFSKFSKLESWINSLKSELPYYQEINGDGVAIMKKFRTGEGVDLE